MKTIESFSETLGVVSALEPEHISVYGLILEEGTPLYEERESYNFPSEDEECDMYALASELLSKSGYEHYEVSNYSKPCKHSKHNLKYWRAEEYIGVGLSAHSHLDGVRFGNTKKLSDYITSPGKPVEKVILDKDSVEYEYVMLRTRLAEGFSLSEYKKLFCKDFLDGREKIVSSLTNSGYVKISGDRFFFTEKGMYVGNSLLTQLI